MLKGRQTLRCAALRPTVMMTCNERTISMQCTLAMSVVLLLITLYWLKSLLCSLNYLRVFSSHGTIMSCHSFQLKKFCFAVWEMRYEECLSHCRRHVTQRPRQSQLVNRPDRLVTGTAAGNWYCHISHSQRQMAAVQMAPRLQRRTLQAEWETVRSPISGLIVGIS